MSPVKRTGWRLIALVAVFSLLLAACGDDDEETTTGGATDTTTEAGGAGTATLAFAGALTGDNANLGINIRDGIKVAVEEENAKGGTRIVLKEFDTAGDPAQAATIKDRFIGDQSVLGLVGTAFSGETKAVIPDIANAGLVMISPSATNVDLPNIVPNNPTFHRVIGDDALQALGIARYLAETEKPASVAYVHDNTEYGKGLTVALEQEASNLGVRRAGDIFTVDPKAQDFSATVNSVRAANPAAIFYGGYYAEAGRFRKQLVDAGVRATFVSGDGSLDPGFITAAGAQAAEGARIACPCNLALESSTGALKAFYDSFTEKIGREPGLYSPEGYDAAKILIRGIKEGNTDRAKLLNYVESIERFEGASKIIEFEPNGNLVRRQFFVFQVKDGELAPLGTVNVGQS
ncbi:MAG TPA: branched-chain amino acid ABC transporter substrate-binding protein [Acidimicrobiales bacterium]|nr:branched-chain amino acid ABC transporter substrate-binding protein [Acidimicrobiales bacterium]